MLLICSCAKRTYKVIDYGRFDISVPEKWNKYERKGLDSYVGGIITDKNDTLTFNLGQYSGDVSTDFPMVYSEETLTELSKRERDLLLKTKHLITEDWSSEDIDLSDYLKYDVEYDTIACFKVKIIRPRNKGFGASGIYIDSLTGSKQDYDKIKFNFYGQFLSDKTQAEFIKALKTLKFEKYCE